ncbi:hypothetical protein OESDEN_09874 [Oesophagostomum dentatum]|uniref:SXP/RAL-2 family protein Ani s 5-like cation-binding domain-containing protein n=1 Tax=Oesophagostomum dentatum TaxID=61180 RepID=A0A0B1SYB0_OESDE|nr:hypothetical protein OESDEN_09874 [Oesophagostomum dentatum]
MIWFILATGLVSVVCEEWPKTFEFPIYSPLTERHQKSWPIGTTRHVTIYPAGTDQDLFKKATSEAKKEYLSILNEQNNTVAQEKERIQAWAKKHNLEKEFKESEEAMDKSRAEGKKDVLALISNLSAVNSEYVKIEEDMSLTRSEIKQKIRDLWQKYPKELKLILYARSLTDGRKNDDPFSVSLYNTMLWAEKIDSR